MNNRNAGAVLAVLALSLLVAGLANAAPFEPSFTVVKVAGTCQVQLPGTNEFVAAAEGQVCQYGTVIKTAAGSSCIVSFSENNGCLVGQNTTVAIEEKEKDKKSKILRITEGEVEFNLEKGFRKHNRLTVVTPSGSCEAIACTCAVEYRVIGDLKTSSYRCTEGDVGVRGNFFAIEDMGANEQATVAQSPNDNFMRIKNVKGDMTMVVNDDKGAEKKVATTSGDELTIMTNDNPTDPSKLDIVYKIVFADTQKAEQSWVRTYAKTAVAPPEGPSGEEQLPQPLTPERKWSSLTVAPPIPTVTPVGKQ